MAVLWAIETAEWSERLTIRVIPVRAGPLHGDRQACSISGTLNCLSDSASAACARNRRATFVPLRAARRGLSRSLPVRTGESRDRL